MVFATALLRSAKTAASKSPEALKKFQVHISHIRNQCICLKSGICCLFFSRTIWHTFASSLIFFILATRFHMHNIWREIPNQFLPISFITNRSKSLKLSECIVGLWNELSIKRNAAIAAIQTSVWIIYFSFIPQAYENNLKPIILYANSCRKLNECSIVGVHCRVTDETFWHLCALLLSYHSATFLDSFLTIESMNIE